MSEQKGAEIQFTARIEAIDSTLILRLPAPASQRLPSRGQVAAHGTMSGRVFRTVLEPDGSRGHWIRIDGELCESTRLAVGDSVSLSIAATKDWPEPEVPGDLATALTNAPDKIRDIWNDVTPMARWEWVRWVNATANPATRQRRIEATISKIDHGKRRPCCFDLSACTDVALAKNGKLRDPS